MMNMSRIGFSGVPIGEATAYQRKPKQEIPCSDFKNTLNHETALNNEKVLNVECAMNREEEMFFNCSDDILEILRTHPDFARSSPENPFLQVEALYLIKLIYSLIPGSGGGHCVSLGRGRRDHSDHP